MAMSAPHVYLSALPFAPTFSLVSAHYSSSFPQTLHVEHGRLSHWPSLEMVISGVGSQVLSIALSPDGQHIASGSSGSNNLCVEAMPQTGDNRGWRQAHSLDTHIGLGLWHSHQMASTLSQAQMMKQFVCGTPLQERQRQAHSLDTQIRSLLWHSHQMASTLSQAQMIIPFVCGMLLQENRGRPIHWTHKWVSSVAFSPDGQHIVSGSSDQTICVWNATTGETEAGPFTGHTNWVTSVAFSPDGQHIVSGSNDQTICVWNTTTGETEAGPFTGHTDVVTVCGILTRWPAHCLRLR
jgi:WD40 repeat protein